MFLNQSEKVIFVTLHKSELSALKLQQTQIVLFIDDLLNVLNIDDLEKLSRVYRGELFFLKTSFLPLQQLQLYVVEVKLYFWLRWFVHRLVGLPNFVRFFRTVILTTIELSDVQEDPLEVFLTLQHRCQIFLKILILQCLSQQLF